MRIVLKSLAALGLIALAACAGAVTTVPLEMGERGYPIRIETRRVPLGVAGADLAAGVSYAGGLSLHGANLHGLSDLKLDGDQAWSVSDFGVLVRFRIQLDGAGRLIGADEAGMRRLIDTDGSILQPKTAADAEGLALLNGAVAISFERNDRIWSYGPDALGLPTPLRRPDAVFPDNEGMEGLSAAPGGGWLALGEGGGAWVCQPDACRALPNAPTTVTDGFKFTSADVDPESGWFVLQRSYSPPLDMRARVRRMAPDGTLGPVLIALRTPASVDNFEGIAVQRTAEGARLYILSDDNANPLEKTLLLAFDVRPAR
ncbi:esterase-like activity of phytase family protein [soil metagenome]